MSSPAISRPFSDSPASRHLVSSPPPPTSPPNPHLLTSDRLPWSPPTSPITTRQIPSISHPTTRPLIKPRLLRATQLPTCLAPPVHSSPHLAQTPTSQLIPPSPIQSAPHPFRLRHVNSTLINPNQSSSLRQPAYRHFVLCPDAPSRPVSTQLALRHVTSCPRATAPLIPTPFRHACPCPHSAYHAHFTFRLTVPYRAIYATTHLPSSPTAQADPYQPNGPDCPRRARSSLNTSRQSGPILA